jgi:phage gp29-like protein
MATQKTVAPPAGELATPDNPFAIQRVTALRAAPYTDLLNPTDSVLVTKGGVDNLKIYRELMRDDQVASVWAQRRLALTSCDTVVEPGAEDALSKAAADALRLEVDAMDWDDITDKHLTAAFYGWGVGEIMWKLQDGRIAFDTVKVRDRGRFRFGRSGALYLVTIGGVEEMPPRKFWTITAGADNHDEPYGLGLAHALYWPVFFKRNDIKFWLIFLEKFGMPTAVAKVPAGILEDPTKKAQVIAMLKNIATDAGVAIPDTVVVELLEAARTGAADYGAMHEAMNAAISKIVVGQTMTTDDGSSKSQAEVHAGVAQKIVEADSDLLCGTFNRGPVQWWTEWNFPGAVPPKVYRHTEPAEDLNVRAERDNKIKTLGYNPTEEYILETYGEGWEKAPEPDPLTMIAGAMKPNPNDPKKANFAETEPLALAALKAARRGDQDAIYRAAQVFASQYRTLTGERVQALLQEAEFAEDPDTFKRKLDELLAEAPAQGALDKLTNATFFARMLGALRGQRAK